MQEQSLSSLSFVPYLEDAYLGQLFEALQNNQEVAINGLNMDCQQMIAQNYKISINPEDIEKGYDSDEGPAKKSKNKKIKKKKPMFIQREEQNKKRRIKLYIQQLENRINTLQTQNERLRKINQLNIDYIRRIKDSEHIVNGFFIDRQKLFSRIEKLLQQSNPDYSKIQIQCQNVRRRQGAFGNQRMKAVNYYFKQLLHMIVPTLQKYIFDAAYNSTDIFNPDYRTKTHQAENLELIKKISPSDEIIKLFLEKQADIINIRNKFNKKVLEMYNNKCELIKMIREMEKICEFYGGKVNPFQKAKFFCYAQRYKQENNAQDYHQELKSMYDQLEKCKKFSYNLQQQTRGNSTKSGNRL